MLPLAYVYRSPMGLGQQLTPAVRHGAQRLSFAASASDVATWQSAQVRELLSVIEDTDRGVAATPAVRDTATAIIEALEDSWDGTNALARPDALFRRAEVAYVGQTNSVRANAAGGQFRGRLGRLAFRTDALDRKSVV